MRGEIELRRQTDMLQMLSSQNRPTYYNSLTYNKSVDLLSAIGAGKEETVFTQQGKQTQTERERPGETLTLLKDEDPDPKTLEGANAERERS